MGVDLIAGKERRGVLWEAFWVGMRVRSLRPESAALVFARTALLKYQH